MKWIKRLVTKWVQPEPQIVWDVLRVQPVPRKSPRAVLVALQGRGMTQNEIAKIAGTSQATISRIMGGEDRNTGYLLVDALRDLLESKEEADRLQGS